MNLAAKPYLIVATVLMLLAVTPAASAPAPCSDVPSLEAESIPDDICLSLPANHEAFARLSWHVFKLLVWPAMLNAGSRGEPDGVRGIADLHGPRVFETYKSDWETFPTVSADRVGWDLYPSDTAVCRNASAMPPLIRGSLVLASLRKFESVTQPDSPGNGQGHRLMAQNGNLVRYLAAFDRNAFKLIQDNYRLYRSLDLAASEDDPIAAAPDGTITVKSAWIEITASSDPGKFYVRDDAWVQDPSTGDCRPANKVALVGLHVVIKTKLRPQWTWASFEHVDNVPAPGDPEGRSYTFHDGSANGMPANPPIQPATPYNVTRLSAIAAAVETVNDDWQTALRNAGSVWANYKLVVVQWARMPQIQSGNLFDANAFLPAPPCGEANPHTNMANAVMETHVQSKPTCGIDDLEVRRTCMGCHISARNYDFIFAIPNNIGNAPNAGVSRAKASVLSILRRNVGGSDR